MFHFVFTFFIGWLFLVEGLEAYNGSERPTETEFQEPKFLEVERRLFPRLRREESNIAEDLESPYQILTPRKSRKATVSLLRLKKGFPALKRFEFDNNMKRMSMLRLRKKMSPLRNLHSNVSMLRLKKAISQMRLKKLSPGCLENECSTINEVFKNFPKKSPEESDGYYESLKK